MPTPGPAHGTWFGKTVLDGVIILSILRWESSLDPLSGTGRHRTGPQKWSRGRLDGWAEGRPCDHRPEDAATGQGWLAAPGSWKGKATALHQPLCRERSPVMTRFPALAFRSGENTHCFWSLRLCGFVTVATASRCTRLLPPPCPDQVAFFYLGHAFRSLLSRSFQQVPEGSCLFIDTSSWKPSRTTPPPACVVPQGLL